MWCVDKTFAVVCGLASLTLGGCVDLGEDRVPDDSADSSTPDDPPPVACAAADGEFASINLKSVQLPMLWSAEQIGQMVDMFPFQTLLSEGDLDGDGLPELVASTVPGHAVVLHNDGECGFTEWLDLGPVTALRVVDINGDGHQDLLSVVQDDPATFAQALFDAVSCYADLGRSDCPDKFIPDMPAHLQVLLNDGSGTPEAFNGPAVVSGAPINGCESFVSSGGEPRALFDVVFSLHTYDLNGDGDLEVVASPFEFCGAVAYSFSSEPNGGGELSVYEGALPSCRAESGFTLEDLNGDGVADVACINHNEPWRVGPTFYNGLGGGDYDTTPFQTIAPSSCPMGVVFMDDGEGTGEVEMVTSAIGDLPRYLLHESGELFLAGSLPVENRFGGELVTWSVVGMEDGLGAPILFAVGGRDLPLDPSPQHSAAFCGEPLAPCPDALGLVDDGVSDENIATRVDIDGDGDQDVVLGSQDPAGPPLRILVNGNGVSGETTFVLVEAMVQAVATGSEDPPRFPSFGARVVAEYSDGWLVAHHLSDGSRLGTASRAVVGLATTRGSGAILEGMTVHWPDGSSSEVDYDGSAKQTVVRVLGE